MSGNTVHILLIDDDRVDAETVKQALREQRIANPVSWVRDVAEPLQTLRGEGGRQPLQRPHLILLDLNLPGLNRLEFLRELREDRGLRESVIFVMTTSDDDRDELAPYDNNVAGYLVKSKVGEGFLDLVSRLDHYWRVVEFPAVRAYA